MCCWVPSGESDFSRLRTRPLAQVLLGSLLTWVSALLAPAAVVECLESRGEAEGPPWHQMFIKEARVALSVHLWLRRAGGGAVFMGTFVSWPPAGPGGEGSAWSNSSTPPSSNTLTRVRTQSCRCWKKGEEKAGLLIWVAPRGLKVQMAEEAARGG